MFIRCTFKGNICRDRGREAPWRSYGASPWTRPWTSRGWACQTGWSPVWVLGPEPPPPSGSPAAHTWSPRAGPSTGHRTPTCSMKVGGARRTTSATDTSFSVLATCVPTKIHVVSPTLHPSGSHDVNVNKHTFDYSSRSCPFGDGCAIYVAVCVCACVVCVCFRTCSSAYVGVSMCVLVYVRVCAPCACLCTW